MAGAIADLDARPGTDELIRIPPAVLWLWIAEGTRPDRYDLLGAAVCLVGAAIIYFGPRVAVDN